MDGRSTLLDRRAWMARRIGEIKHQNALAAYAPARERVVLDRVAALSEGEFPRRGLQAVFREIISSSISLEGRLKVAYLGPEATFTHEAALRSFGSSIELEPQTTVAEVFAGSSAGKSSTASCRRELDGGGRDPYPGRAHEQPVEDLR